MKTQTDFLQRNKVLKGRITLVNFNTVTNDRTLTYSGLNLVQYVEETALRMNTPMIKVMAYVDLPRHLESPEKLTDEWMESVDQYRLSLYI